MLVVAFVVDAVAACHKHDGQGRGEHEFAADWTVAFRRAFDAPVRVFELDGHADAAFLAVEKVLAEAVTDSADTAVVAVVNALVRVVIPKFTLP